MIAYLLKSGACLLVFYLFYALFLEKENMHLYKRVYLLATIAASFIIPFITFTNYVEIVEQITPLVMSQDTVTVPLPNEVESEPYLPMFLWGTYALGVLFFSIKFIKNITEIIIKVRNNPKEGNGGTTAILLEESIVPHTFFNFIFLNKSKYLANQIPKEVLFHEEAHANQKHSIDVLLIEVVQVIFWFNPIVYLLKRAIKLNHEFLADQAVLNHGANTKIYQQTLLAFSSNDYQLPLANAINYSSIKKRLTIMKTQTSKKKIWIRSFILLPVLVLLLFSFTTKETVRINADYSKVSQRKATPKQVAEYNALAKKYNNQAKKNMNVRLQDVKRLEYLYKLMTSSQKSEAEKFPNFPPMPAIPKVVEIVNDPKSNVSSPKTPVKVIEIKNAKSIKQLPKEANYIVDNKKVSYDEASKISNDKIQSVDVVTKDENGNKLEQSLIYIYTKKVIKVIENSKRPITLINGIKSREDRVLELTKGQLEKMVVTVGKGKVTEFKIKFPKKPTVTVSSSSTLNKEAKTFLQEAKIGQMVQIFNLKSSESELKSHPVLFEIIE